ncbi:hypothetical protein TIFTF001_033730 [Ficus carica]|uniref:Uncharacterized protein n=1 Tax=Ficus carica TaxID=3494 RepID=A0AA88DYR2_FICCA|nr:hypothetical protein TIFTF001_033730 [Ficus carica]
MDGKNKNQSNMEDKSAMNFLIYTFVLCSYLTLCTARDTMRHGDRILGDAMENNTLISAGGKFELGFFTLNESGSDEIRTYVGIWYHKFSPKTIVWVANRTDPLLKSSGVFRIAEDGNLQILDDTTGKSYWSTCLEKSSSSSNRSVTLMDTGNLELRENSNGQWAMRSLWESFLDPTDTFLPGMKMDENFKLTSWKDEGNPETGAFCFTQDHKRENRYVVMNDLVPYWKSGEAGTFFGSAKMPDSILNLLSNIISNPKVYFGMRLVIKSDGTIQYLKWDERKKAWSLLWWEPRDKCGVFMACGNFGSCNSKNRLTCKCLPGFKPKSPGKWNLGDFFGGCNRGKELCVEKNTKFLRLKMMKVDDPDSGGLPVDNETECRNKCLGDCLCQAYSFQPPDKSISQRRDSGHPNTSLCWTWRESLNNLQEDYARGREIFARVVSSDIGDFKATSTGDYPC